LYAFGRGYGKGIPPHEEMCGLAAEHLPLPEPEQSELPQQGLDVVEAHGVLRGEFLFSSSLQTGRKRPLSVSS